MKRYRNVNNHGSVFRARRPLLPRVQPVVVSPRTIGVLMVERIFVTFVYIARTLGRWHPVTVKTGEYIPRTGSPNSGSRRRVCNYKRMQKRGIRHQSDGKIYRLFNL